MGEPCFDSSDVEVHTPEHHSFEEQSLEGGMQGNQPQQQRRRLSHGDCSHGYGACHQHPTGTTPVHRYLEFTSQAHGRVYIEKFAPLWTSWAERVWWARLAEMFLFFVLLCTLNLMIQYF